MKRIIELPDRVVEAIQNGEDYRYDIHTAIAQSTPYNPTGDCISREALKKEFDKECQCDCSVCEHSRFDNFKGYYHCGIIDNAQAVDLWQMRQEATENALKKAREADRWIPVSERLPEESDYYLVTSEVRYGMKYVCLVFYNASKGKFLKDASISVLGVIAWKPLPEPYEMKGGAE